MIAVATASTSPGSTSRPAPSIRARLSRRSKHTTGSPRAMYSIAFTGDTSSCRLVSTPRSAVASQANTSRSGSQPGNRTQRSRPSSADSARSSSRHSPSPRTTNPQSSRPKPCTTRSAARTTRSTRSWRPILPIQQTRYRCPSRRAASGSARRALASTGPLRTTDTASGAAPAATSRSFRYWFTVTLWWATRWVRRSSQCSTVSISAGGSSYRPLSSSGIRSRWSTTTRLPVQRSSHASGK